MSEIQGRIDFITIIEVNKANPNGDPGNDNRPRQTEEGFGEISDVCIKRKIRNRLQDLGCSIYLQSEDRSDDGILNLHDRLKNNIDIASVKKNKKELNRLACEKWIDVRAFGSVFAFKGDSLTSGIRGAVTIQPAFSVNEIDIETTSITKSVNSEATEKRASDTMGEKHRVNYGVYVIKGSINARTAQLNGLTKEDCDKLFEAIRTLFINDDTCARPSGTMNVLKTYIFEHNNIDGQYSPLEVFNSIQILSEKETPTNFNDFRIEEKELPGLTVLKY